jgi:hypothetical protein
MSRMIFRVVMGLTLVVMYFARRSGGHMGARAFVPFYYWFLATIVVFSAFGLVSAYRAFREPHNRRALLFDVLLAAIWVPYWFANTR